MKWYVPALEKVTVKVAVPDSLVFEDQIDPETLEGGSTFLVDVAAFDHPIGVQADTIAMSTPHLIDYALRFDSASIQSAK